VFQSFTNRDTGPHLRYFETTFFDVSHHVLVVRFVGSPSYLKQLAVPPQPLDLPYEQGRTDKLNVVHAPFRIYASQGNYIALNRKRSVYKSYSRIRW
jgi:hypothetical protein